VANFKILPNFLTWSLSAVGGQGNFLGNFDVVLPFGQARTAALDAVRFAHSAGADINLTIRGELEANEDRVASLLKDLKSSRSRSQIDLLSKALTTLIEYAQYLQTAYISPHDFEEGSIHVVRSETEPAGTHAYFVMFSSYLGSGGTMKPRSFPNEDALLHFLVNQLTIDLPVAEQAIRQANEKGSANIPNVKLTKERQIMLQLL